MYNLTIGYTPGDLTEAIRETIRETIRRNEFKNCYIRPTAYFDAGSLGIRSVCPTGVNILTWEWPNDFGAEKLTKGMRGTVSPYRKFHSSMIPTTAKATGNYLNSILAVREAAARIRRSDPVFQVTGHRRNSLYGFVMNSSTVDFTGSKGREKRI